MDQICKRTFKSFVLLKPIPEVLLHVPFNAKALNVFQVGVLLFELRKGHQPVFTHEILTQILTRSLCGAIFKTIQAMSLLKKRKVRERAKKKMIVFMVIVFVFGSSSSLGAATELRQQAPGAETRRGALLGRDLDRFAREERRSFRLSIEWSR